MGAVITQVTLNKAQMLESARCMFEIQGLSLVKIAKTFGVSEGCVYKWRDKYNWASKGAEQYKVQELTRQKFMEYLATQGLPPEKVAKLLIKGITTPKQDQIVEIDPKTKEAKTLFEGNPDHKTRHKYLHDYLVLTGLIGNNKTLDIQNHGEGSLNVQVNLPTKE